MYLSECCKFSLSGNFFGLNFVCMLYKFLNPSMSNKLLTPVFILSTLLFASCRTFSVPNESKEWLMISEGGGFTGIETGYFLIPNGQVFYFSGPDSGYKELPKLSRRTSKQFFHRVQTAMPTSSDKQSPDNINKTVSWHKGNQTLSATWYRNFGEHDSILQFYNDVLNTTSKQWSLIQGKP
jgi:hypothetical protein